MRQALKFGLGFLLLSTFTHSNAQPTPGDTLVGLFGADLCPRLEPLPDASCKEILRAASNSTPDSPVDLDALEAAVAAELTSPDFLNSALSKVFGGNVPFGLEFKELDGENGEPTLGLSYSIDYQLADRGVSSAGDWNRRYSLAFKGTGTYTQDPLENPRNFLDTKFTVKGSRSTRIPEQSDEFGLKITNLALEDALCTDPPSEACIQARQEGFQMLDDAAKFLKNFHYYEFGLDAGVESDQDFDIKQSKFSAFLFGQIESWGSGSVLDAFNLSPAFRISLDSVDPNSQSPRALAGDDSSFVRLSGEVSLWIPLNTRVPLAFTFNYRHHRELNASSVIKNANLDSYDIRTFSLTGTNGLFVTYSSGRLPLDVQSDDVVEIGWKTYF